MRVNYFLDFGLLVPLLLLVTTIFTVVILVHGLHARIVLHFRELGHSVLLDMVIEPHDYYLGFLDLLALLSSTFALVFNLLYEVSDNVPNVMNYCCGFVQVLSKIDGEYEGPRSGLIDSKTKAKHTIYEGLSVAKL